MKCNNLLTVIIFLIFISINSSAQRHLDYIKTSIDVDIHINSGKIYIDPNDTKELKIHNRGREVKINVYGIYSDSITTSPPTEKEVNLIVPFNSNVVQSKKSLTPIIIPPTNPDPGNHQYTADGNSRVFIGNTYLFLEEYSIRPNDYNFTIEVSENKDNRLVIDSEKFPINIYDIDELGELTLDYAEIVYPENKHVLQGYYIKGYIHNSKINKIDDLTKIKYYFNKEHPTLLGTTIIEPLESGHHTTFKLFIDYSKHQMISGKQIKIIADEDKEIFESNDDDIDNIIFYEIPAIKINSSNIKVYPNPFQQTVNFKFQPNNIVTNSTNSISDTITSTALLEIFNRNGLLVYSKECIFQANTFPKTISFLNDDTLPSGNYLYSLLIYEKTGDTKYQGVIVKK